MNKIELSDLLTSKLTEKFDVAYKEYPSKITRDTYIPLWAEKEDLAEFIYIILEKYEQGYYS